jgi:hypothetical protein
MIYEDKIKEVNQRLRDFQHITVDYLVHRMYDEGQNRMLVADEVGLGKTWIAKGVIVKAYERWCNEASHIHNKHFNIFYICSNQQLISQNLKEINFTKDERCVVNQVNRISMLALKPENDEVPIHIYALTPDTSFNQYSSQGIKSERYIIYTILNDALPKEVSRRNLSRLMKGFMDIEWNVSVNNISWWKNRLRPSLCQKYVEALKECMITNELLPSCYDTFDLSEGISLWNVLIQVVSAFPHRNPTATIFNELIGMMRKVMTDICLSLMDADIYVMDEFQRYSQLIDTKSGSEQATIAQKVFGQTEAKVIMLSATPFKAFTNQYDEQHDEQHYKELKRVLKFLYEGKNVDWASYENARGRIFSLMLQLKDAEDKESILSQIEELNKVVEDVYTKVIVRTEKIIASKDPNAMVENTENHPLQATKQEIDDFVKLDTVFRSIYERQKENAPSPIDYAKSAPYAMSFLRDYKVGEKAKGKEIKLSKNAFINLDEINQYRFPRDNHWPNGKLQILMKNLKQEAKLLWCPPSMPYYPLEGVFKGQLNFTKTLVFSAWKLVPKMIATLVSYETEKQTIGQYGNIKYFPNRRVVNQGDKVRKPRRKLEFKKNANNFTTLILAYPSVSLANRFDPLEFKGATEDWKTITKEKQKELIDSIKEFCKQGDNEISELSHISWAYPIVNDKEMYAKVKWLDKGINVKGQEDTETFLTSKYIPELVGYLSDVYPKYPKKIKNGELKKQTKLIFNMTLGNPGVCAFRALRRYYGETSEVYLAAFQIGLAFIDLFNKPESIAVIEKLYEREWTDYWQKVVQYCVDGNLQAVLDEYIFMLKNGYNKVEKLAEVVCNVLSMRTTRLKVDDASSLCKDESMDADIRHTMRSHYAAAFGINARSSQGSEVRATSIREAFNSPFRPFVLATTSIGQEGLDFHWYCRRIVHWNLPNNPIDFEQREGRINRFRGKVIRQRVANKYGNEKFNTKDPWNELFERAKADKTEAKFPCDIVPNWHFDADDVGIERIVPIYQFSQDVQRYADMLHVLGLYRLTFGQPRQEELAEALDCCLTDEELDKLMIDLCPMRRKKNH